MSAKTWSVMLLFLLTINSILAGTFQTNSAVTIVQPCDNSTYSNITLLTYPNSTLAIGVETVMTANGDVYNYTFSNTAPLGEYFIYGHCDENGVDITWSQNFEITYTGQKVSLSNSIIVVALIALAAIFLTISFFFKGDYWMLATFFQFLSVLSGLVAVNSAKIIASESSALGTMGGSALVLIIVVVMLFFLWMFVRAFKEIVNIFKRKGDLRWSYD